MGARELREGVGGTATSVPPDFVAGLTNEQLFDSLAIQLDGPRASGRQITLHWRFTDTDDEYGLTLANGVLTHRRGAPAGAVDAIVGVERAAINEVVAGAATLEAVAGAGRLTIEGDQTKLGGLLSLLDPPDPKFAIVTP